MSITRRCDYACRIIRAAYRSGDTYISIAEVAEQEGRPAENYSWRERRSCPGV